MKVWQLRKINEVAKANNFSLDYENLLNMDQTDIELLVRKIEEKNENIESLVSFLDYIQDNPEWEKSFSHLQGIKEINLKKYIFERIENATSEEDADAILGYFDLEDSGKLSMFQTVEEWKTYIETINSNMENYNTTAINNLYTVLKNSSENRCNLIQKVMKYSLSDDLNPVDLFEYPINFQKMPITFDDLFALFLDEYDPDAILNLVMYWMEKRENTSLTENKEIDDSFNEIFNHLKDSNMMAEYCDIDNFLEMIKKLSPSECRDLITTLKEIEKEKDCELLQLCINKMVPFDNINMKVYVTRILRAKEDEYNYRRALIYLWDKGIIEKNMDNMDNMDRITEALGLVQISHKNSMDMARFIEKLPNIEIIRNMIILEAKEETLQTLYNKFPTLIPKDSLSTEQIEYYRNLLNKLSKLAGDICDKVLKIMSLSFVRNMSIENKNELQEILFNSENLASLDYIYEEYRKKDEQEYVLKQYANSKPIGKVVKLSTVLELLKNGDDFDAILDGFGDEDEITPKTLIRSLAYKNKQN